MLKERHVGEKIKKSLVEWAQKPFIYMLITFKQELLNWYDKTVVFKWRTKILKGTEAKNN